MVLFYVYDEFTDIEGPKVSGHIASIVMDAMRNPHKPRPKGEFLIAELARQYWAEAMLVASPMAQTHFIDTFQQYVNAVTEQAVDREADRIRTIDDYWKIRDHTGGCLPSFNFIELTLDFPDKLYNSPELERLREIANRSIAGCNDVYSYNVERTRGHALHNIVTVAMYEKNLQVKEAVEWFNDWHNDILREFLALREQVDVSTRREYGDEVAKQVRFYVDGLAMWVRGSDDWHFEGQRHFGELGPQIQKTREVLMLPCVDAAIARAGIPVGGGKDGVDGEMIRELMETNNVAGLQIDAGRLVPTETREGGEGGWYGRLVRGSGKGYSRRSDGKDVVSWFSSMALAFLGVFRPGKFA